MPPPPSKRLDQVRDRRRLKHSSPRTEDASVQWSTRSILFHNKRYPLEMGAPKIEAFLNHLAVEGGMRYAGTARGDQFRLDHEPGEA